MRCSFLRADDHRSVSCPPLRTTKKGIDRSRSPSFAPRLLSQAAGNLPPESWVDPFGTFWGAPDARELPTGEWADFAAGWGTVTEQQRDHFLDTVIVEVECDGVPQNVTPLLFFADDAALFVATFHVLVEPGAVEKSQEWTMRWTFTEDHDDGSGLPPIPADTVFEGTRTIVWTLGGQFPSGDYPPSDF